MLIRVKIVNYFLNYIKRLHININNNNKNKNNKNANHPCKFLSKLN